MGTMKFFQQHITWLTAVAWGGLILVSDLFLLRDCPISSLFENAVGFSIIFSLQLAGAMIYGRGITDSTSKILILGWLLTLSTIPANALMFFYSHWGLWLLFFNPLAYALGIIHFLRMRYWGCCIGLSCLTLISDIQILLLAACRQ